ncbi:MAG: hypothetical protein LBQ24_02550 [Candidatus Peribacteria bacterium]|nr:hypothetical protein [Candidatus Peribacteria bacterium]
MSASLKISFICMSVSQIAIHIFKNVSSVVNNFQFKYLFIFACHHSFSPIFFTISFSVIHFSSIFFLKIAQINELLYIFVFIISF